MRVDPLHVCLKAGFAGCSTDVPDRVHVDEPFLARARVGERDGVVRANARDGLVIGAFHSTTAPHTPPLADRDRRAADRGRAG